MEVSGQFHVPADLPPGKAPPESIRWEAGWAPESVWGCGEEKNLFPLPGSDPQFLGRPAYSLVIISTELPGSI
jgi:hypothetical protein